MKTLLHLFILVLVATNAFATTITANKPNGSWGMPTTWDKGRVPANNDTIVIPFGKAALVSTSFTYSNVVIIIYGTLKMSGGQLNLNATSTIITYSTGSVILQGLAPTSLISIGGVTKFNVTDVIIPALKFADASTGISPLGFADLSLLPVKLIAFKATGNGNTNEITWSTASEINNQYFELQKSVDGMNWNPIAIIATANTASLIKTYHYSDKQIHPGTVYYRLRQVDRNGDIEFSQVISVRTNNTTATKIYVSGKQTVSVAFNSEVKNVINIRVTTIHGEMITNQYFPKGSNHVTVNMVNAARGIYIVQVRDNQTFAIVQKIAL